MSCTIGRDVDSYRNDNLPCLLFDHAEFNAKGGDE
jgi:hypothetical protein